jgi:N-acetylated-alpha-linked acidic dipeptidase
MDGVRPRGPVLWAVLVVLGLTSPAPSTQERAKRPAGALAGYTASRAAQQQRIEAAYAAIPSAERAREVHRFLTAEPHPAGSRRNNQLAEWMAAEWRAQGWDEVVVHRYDVLQSEPRKVTLEMIAPKRYRASLREDPYDADPDTRHPDVTGAWLGFSASGEVTAPVVYAHSGNPEDYAHLRRSGIDVRGKIALVRYSNPYSYRGFKALTAEREGVAALLIYSDPAEDGYRRGTVYPDGPWGPESHIQRGSITYDFLVPGDPLTPGWPSLPGVRRLSREEARSLPKIIAVPLSWRDARPLLEHMDGPVAPPAWQGGLPIRYRLGGSAVRVRLEVDIDTRVMPNYVVEARIRGSEFPDEWIVLGNHRDAWVFGGVDPSSGTASQLEVTRGLGELLRQGIRPRRTIVMCSWDGEEFALTGSTEWGEQFADELSRKGVAYLNVDSSTSGPAFEPSAVPSLAGVLVEVSRTLRDPATGKTLYEAWRAARSREERGAGAGLVDTRIGSGSDHTVFLNFLGLPSVLLEFNGPYGVYHSVYDSHTWMSRFGDPGFRYHRLMAQVWGALALRLANADLLPYDFRAYAAGLQRFLEDLVRANPAMSTRLELQTVRRSLAALERAAAAWQERARAELLRGGIPAERAARINGQLLQFERHWLHPDGIPGRPWFKHLIYAARYTYAHLELPGLTEAVEAGDWTEAERQLRILDAAIRRNTQLLEQLPALLD